MSEWRRRQAAAGGTIAGHLRSLVFLCSAMLLVVSVTAFASLEVQSENIGRLTLIDGPALDANNSVRAAMSDAQIGLSGYQASGDRGLLAPYLGAQGRAMASLATLAGKVSQESVSGADAVRLQGLAQGQRLAAQRWWANAVLVEQTLTAGGRADLSVSRSLFDTFSAANTALGDYLTVVADQTRLAARSLSSQGEVVAVAATLAALLTMLILGGRAARRISSPLTDLRDTMVRQRGGERGARAREDRGSLELRSVAGDFNTLTEANLVLLTVQARDLGTQQITLQIGRAIRRASDTQEALDFMCVAVGEGLGVDRVIASTFGAEHEMRLGAQWQRPNVLPLKDLAMLQHLGGLAEELWLSGGFRAEANLPETDTTTQPGELGLLSRDEIGGRAVIMVPVGFDDRLMGMICVIMVHHPRAWTVAEANVVQAVAGFVAKAIVAAEHQDYQHEYVERIETLDRQKSDFLATISHELRTPLTSIIGYLELLQEGAGHLTGQQQKMLHVIDRNTVRLRSLIEDVMVLSRIEGGVSKAGFVEVSIRAVITRVGEELSVLAQERGITLQIAAGPRAALVLGDPASLDRAVVNVLSNAIKFSRPAGVVTIGCTLDTVARRVVITCQDHGVGIPAQDLPDLFTRFFRASNATDQSIPGTGLGLSIAKQIVEDHHGGEMRLTSVQDEGTTVVIDLPLYELSAARGHLRDDCGGDGLVVSEPVGNGSSSGNVFGIRA